jgi:hypothetical protein
MELSSNFRPSRSPLNCIAYSACDAPHRRSDRNAEKQSVFFVSRVYTNIEKGYARAIAN